MGEQAPLALLASTFDASIQALSCSAQATYWRTRNKKNSVAVFFS